jgi:hypothetical protein
MALKRPAFEMPRKHFGLIHRASGSVRLEVQESEFTAAKRLFPDVEWN